MNDEDQKLLPFLSPTDICRCGSVDISLTDSDYTHTNYTEDYQCDKCFLFWKVTYQIIKIEEL